MKPCEFGCVLALTVSLAGWARAASPALTIYNQDFAVVRETIALDLKAGVNDIRHIGTAAHLEPDSVILRDPTGARTIQVLEQNYRGDPVSQGLLLAHFEGETIDFAVIRDGKESLIPGKIIRSGYVPHYAAMRRYGQQYYQRQMQMAGSGGQSQPIIELEGKLRFGLPGTPLFPELGDDTVLKPTLHWKLETDQPGRFEAELGYVTGGMRWEADYNLVASTKGDVFDLVGWVTIDNQSGKTFHDARIKLIAGDVHKVQPQQDQMSMFRGASGGFGGVGPAVTEKAFDEYHMYTLQVPSTVRDRETKQVEFVRAADVAAERIYVYDGAKIDHRRYSGWSAEAFRTNAEYGTQSNPKVWAMLEFANSEANHLGMPLPRGRMRFYRQDNDGQLEFTGEDLIDHTPRDETARVYTGNAFDLVGERKRTDFRLESGGRELYESFQINLRNHKTAPVEIRVVEHLYRWFTWDIEEASKEYAKTDSRTIEFRVEIDPDEETVITYTVHYTW